MPIKDDVPHLRVRLEPRLLARLEKARTKSGRTLTGEIAHRLERSFRQEDETADRKKLIEETVDEMARRRGWRSLADLGKPEGRSLADLGKPEGEDRS